jgi:hypothetical protein
MPWQVLADPNRRCMDCARLDERVRHGGRLCSRCYHRRRRENRPTSGPEKHHRIVDWSHAETRTSHLELLCLLEVERQARLYAEFTHGNIPDRERYRRREEARERLRDSLSRLDVIRGKAA